MTLAPPFSHRMGEGWASTPCPRMGSAYGLPGVDSATIDRVLWVASSLRSLREAGGGDFANPFLTFYPWGALIDAKLEEE
jgi:hypothetical protein